MTRKVTGHRSQDTSKKQKMGPLFYILVSCVMCHVSFSQAFAKEITILYTGQTHAMLYTCSCPIEKDGGVARRATLVKEIRKSKPNCLLLDSGSFFAGGALDEFSQNADLDKERTRINLKAMALMQYDAVNIGDDEFNFGANFLEQEISNSKLTFLSSNLEFKKTLPFIIKELDGVKVGIIGLTNQRARQKAGEVNFSEPQAALKKVIDELKSKKIDITIVLSNLSEEENISLAKEVKGIDVLICGYKAKEADPLNVGPTLIVYPSWQGRKLGVLSLSLKDNHKISGNKVDLVRLCEKVKPDPAIERILPRCFSDVNCKNKDIPGICKNPGTLSSSCEFPKPNKIKLLVITSRDCIGCQPEKAVNYLKKHLPGAAVSYLYYPESRANKLIKDLKIKALPVYLLGKEVEQEKGFSSLKQNLEGRGDFYMVRPQASGLAYFLDRDKIKGNFDLFISLHEKESAAILDDVRGLNPELHFLAVEQKNKFDAQAGSAEVEEDLRSVCVKKYYPQKFWDYIICRAKNINSSWWDNCLGGLDPNKIKQCAQGEEGRNLLKENISLNQELQVIIGPTYLIDNIQIFSTEGVPEKDSFKKLLKRK